MIKAATEYKRVEQFFETTFRDAKEGVFTGSGFMEGIEKAIPEEHRELAARVLRNVNWKIVIQAVRETLIKTYTVDEIQAIPDVVDSQEGAAKGGGSGGD